VFTGKPAFPSTTACAGTVDACVGALELSTGQAYYALSVSKPKTQPKCLNERVEPSIAVEEVKVVLQQAAQVESQSVPVPQSNLLLESQSFSVPQSSSALESSVSLTLDTAEIQMEAQEGEEIEVQLKVQMEEVQGAASLSSDCSPAETSGPVTRLPAPPTSIVSPNLALPPGPPFVAGDGSEFETSRQFK
jgi:hypothetical protein